MALAERRLGAHSHIGGLVGHGSGARALATSACSLRPIRLRSVKELHGAAQLAINIGVRALLSVLSQSIDLTSQ